MTRRLLALVLCIATLLSLCTGFASAANTVEDALGEVDIYNGGYELAYLSINGRVQSQKYTYYNYINAAGQQKEIPAYCVNPNLYGVPQTVGVGESISYLAEEKTSDPKVMGIIANGYPTRGLAELGLENKYQAYYATKMALWCYLISDWNINNLKINPSLSGDELTRAQKILAATKDIYARGTSWTETLSPSVTCTPDRDTAYAVTVDGKQYKQQVFTFWSKTWVCDYAVNVGFTDPASVPEGTRIVDLNNRDITTITTEGTGDGYTGQFKVLYPADSIQGETGSVQLSFSTNVYKYAVFYAVCQEKDTYGNLQNYVVDTDPTVTMNLSAYSNYDDNPEDEPDETGLRILKYETGTELPLAGARFEVIGPDGDSIGSFVTDGNGEIFIPLLKTGNYTVIEREAPQHYLISKEPAQNVTVVYDEIAEVTYFNDPYGSLRIEKKSNTGMNLPGAVITIEHIESGQTYTATTNSAGCAIFTEIKPGAYRVQEKTAPVGWKLDDTIYTTTVVAGETTTLPIINEELPGLRIVKYDRKNYVAMPGVTFEIFRDEVSLGKFRTDAFGEILLTDLEPGTYRAVEVDTGNDGYILDTTPQSVELKAGDGIKELTFFNDMKPGMRLIKVDSADPSKVIPNAVFEIKSVAGDYGPEEFTTDENGEIDLSHLPAGAYVVTEKSCPGYIIDEAQRIIQLDPNEDAQFVFTNSIKPSFQLIKLSADGSRLAGVTFRIAKIEDGSHYLDRTTNAQGEILIADLEPGVYSVKETATVADHILDPTEYHVELFPGQTSTITIQNDKRPDLTIRKTDKDTGEPISGVTFRLNYADGPTITTEPTGDDGTVTIENLLPGVYTVTEQSVPEGYILDTTPQQVTLEPNRDATVQFQNYKRPTLTIHKVDINGNALTGAIFEVKTKAGVKIGDFPVGPDGSITIENIHLDEGYYIVTEIQAPDGYILDSTPHEVYLRPGKTTEISIENEKKPGLTIKKIDSVTGNPLKGAKFELWVAKDNTEDGTYQKLDQNFYYTDENGEIYLDKLDTGWYKVVEVDPPTGYALRDPSEQTIYVDNDKAVELIFENTPLSALVVWKFDSVTGEALEGAVFQVRYLGGTSGTGGTVIGTYKTSANGSFTVTGLEAGTYVVEELASPDGHVIDTAPQTVFISGKEQDVVQLYFGNSPKGSLLIKKIDSETHEPLSDVEFMVTTADGTVVGDANGKFVTDSAGTILVEGIDPGTTLVVKETRAKTGYELDDTPQTATIKAGQTVTLEFRNAPQGCLLITKVDSATRKPLSGVQFKIAGCNGCEYPAGTYTTDANGQIKLSNIPAGCYSITETKAAEGYLLNGTAQTVKVESGSCKEVTIANEPLGGLVIKKMDSVTKEPLSEVIFKVTTTDGAVVGTSNGEFRTDENGYITIPDLEPGGYVVQEVKAKEGYLLDNTPKTIQIKDHQTYTLEFFNQPKGNLIINKLDSVTKAPLEGVEFELTYSDGSYVDAEGGTLSSKGLYTTDENGQIILSGLTGTIVVTETKTIEGYTIHEETRTQTVVINPNDTQELTFYNDPVGGVEIIKVDEADKTARLGNATFEIRKMDDALVDTVTTDKYGRVFLALEDGAYYAVEIEAPEGYKLDDTPHYFEVKDGKTSKLTVTNKVFSGILIHKTDSSTGKGIYGVTFLLYDASNNPVGQYTSDNQGYVYIENIETGRYYLRELENEGYILDTQCKTVYVKSGETTLVEWENTPIMGQIQIIKKSADDNPINALPAGTLLEGAVFEVYDKAGNVVDTIVSDYNGRAVSKLLPLGRYTIREVQAPDYYAINPTVLTAYLDYEGQIVTFEVEDNSVSTGVSIKKTGYAEVMPNQPIRYTITGIGNTSTVPLSSFYWRDTLPGQVRLSKVVTGTYNQQLSYKIVYKTNLKDSYQTLADSLSTTKNYVLEASPAALGLASNERVTEIMFVFGTVKGGFGQVETAYIHGNVVNGLANGSSIVNVADIGGVYNGQWIQAVSRWVTKVYAKTITTLPKTGY